MPPKGFRGQTRKETTEKRTAAAEKRAPQEPNGTKAEAQNAENTSRDRKNTVHISKIAFFCDYDTQNIKKIRTAGRLPLFIRYIFGGGG